MKSFRTAVMPCPGCGYPIDACTNIENSHKPCQDDFTICAKCRTWLRFNTDMSLRICDSEDLKELDPDQIDLMRQTDKILEKMFK